MFEADRMVSSLHGLRAVCTARRISFHCTARFETEATVPRLPWGCGNGGEGITCNPVGVVDRHLGAITDVEDVPGFDPGGEFAIDHLCGGRAGGSSTGIT